MTTEPAGANCTYGGQKLQVGGGAATYVCNGAPGATGANGQSVSMTVEPAGANCTNGGEKLQVGGSTPAYVCNGTNGTNGQSVTMNVEPAGANCQYGGEKLQVGSSTSYVCNGGSGILWTAASANTTTAANHGYIATSSSSMTFTLPASTGLTVGEEVDITAQGAGGFIVVPNSGETIQFGSGVIACAGGTWTATGSTGGWQSIASSADGTHLVAGTDTGVIATSTDSGNTWSTTTLATSRTSAGIPANTTVAISADGTVAAAAFAAGSSSYSKGGWNNIYTSTNNASWTVSSDQGSWESVALAPDGKMIYAIADYVISSTNPTYPLFSGLFAANISYTSYIGYGNTSNGNVPLSSPFLSMSPTGVVYYPSPGSSDVCPTNQTQNCERISKAGSSSIGPLAQWKSVASSVDGTRLVAVDGTISSGTVASGHIYVSNNSGFLWAPVPTNMAPAGLWTSVVESSNGVIVAATLSGGQIYMSYDGGEVWIPMGSAGTWTSISSSSDGSRFYATSYGGSIYSSAAPTNTTSQLVGIRGSSVRLLYIGSNTFLVEDGFGQLQAF